MKQLKRREVRTNAEETPELRAFAHEFRDESHLRQITAQLFERMGLAAVTITHGGSTEKGKDIVFYSKGPLEERVLCACVIKNDRITGNAASVSGAGTVLNQALQALREPYINRSNGGRERVGLVYVISPLTSATTAIESIQAQLEDRSGQVAFKCGRDFLKLFEDHWPDFLRFETGVLTRYLASLKSGLTQDKALTTLLGRQGISSGEWTIEDFYIQPQLVVELADYRVREVFVPTISHLTKSMTLGDLRELQSVLGIWAEALKLATIWAADTNRAQEYRSSGESASIVVGAIGKLWERQYRAYETTRSREQRAKVRKGEVRVELEPDDALRRDFEKIASHAAEAYSALEACTRTASEVSRRKWSTCRELLRAGEFVEYCRAEDLSRALPALFERGKVHSSVRDHASLLDDVRSPTLISAPAGFGKSWFCRWHTLRDARQHLQNERAPLPIYVRLHEHGQGKLGSFEETFLPGGEVRSLLQQHTSTEKPRQIRLYLDGLDEIADPKRQLEIIELAREGLAHYPQLQIVVTARDHVRGPWLGWLPRVHLAPFTKLQSIELTGKWLDDQTLAETFQKELDLAPGLTNLMAVPLLATLTVNLYRQTRTLPATRTRLYRLFVELLSGGWDAVKQTHRGGRFGPDSKIVVLTELAIQMQYNRTRDASEQMFRSAIDATLRGFNDSAGALLDEVLQDGLLVRFGSVLMFSHLSFQEYLAGRALQSDPNGKKARNAVNWFLIGDDWWKEPLAYYLGSAQNPRDVRLWLDDAVARVAQRRGTGTDFQDRVAFLMQTIADSFPGVVLD